MANFRLAARAIQQLRAIVRDGNSAREIKRAQALLWRHEGRSVRDVSAELGVTTRTIQRWVGRYQQQAGQPLASRIQVGKPPGRPAKQLPLARRVIEQVWQRDPRRYGFRALVWTVPMLRCLIQRRTKKGLARRPSGARCAVCGIVTSGPGWSWRGVRLLGASQKGA